MENKVKSKAWKFRVLVFLAISLTLSLGFYYNEGNHNISLRVDNEVKDVASRANTVEEFLLDEGISVEKGAYMNVDPDTELQDNMDIVIKNPSTYTISIGEDEFEVKSLENTARGILNDNGVKIEIKDYTYPALDEEVSSNSKIELYQVREVIEVATEPIPYEKVVNKSKKLDLGKEKLVQEGKEGKKQFHITKEYVNGEFVDEEVVKEEIVEEPVPQVVEKGTKPIVVASRASTPKTKAAPAPKTSGSKGDLQYSNVITMSATAYDLSYASCGKNPGDRGYGITASGTKARPGAVAVDPRVIPLGTRLYIESLDGWGDYGFATAEDTGGAIKGNKIDLFYHSSRDVANFGRRNVKVYILK